MQVPIGQGQAKTVMGVECLLDAGQVAMVLGRSTRWVRDALLKTGKLKALRLGAYSYRVRPSDLQSWIDEASRSQ